MDAKKLLSGSIVALATPFDKADRLNEEALREYVQFNIKNGSSGLVPVGTTGESPTLTPEEHMSVFDIVVDEANGKIPVIAGTGSNSTEEALKYTQHALDCGADAVLIVAPYYNRPTDRGIYEHYKTIAEKIDIPVIIYNIPSRTGVNILPDTIAKLAEIDGIIGVKEASGNIGQMAKIISLTRDKNFVLVSGDDALTLPVLSIGGIGVISVVANIIPSDVAKMIRFYNEGKLGKAREIYYKMLPLINAMFIESNPSPLKFAMNEMGMNAGKVRMPLVEVTKEHENVIRCAMKDYGLI